MDDPDLIQSLKSVITPPFNISQRNLGPVSESGHYSQAGQSAFVDKLLKNRVNGFFVECGAYEGLELSNSIFFELKRNWTGLLVEVSPNHFKQIIAKRRHAYGLNACLSPVSAPKHFKYQEVSHLGGLTAFEEKAHVETVRNTGYNATRKEEISVMCYPLYSVMLALGRNHIDYFSLDVEGAELAILKTIPFDKLRIDVIDLEYRVWGGASDTAQKIEKFRQFFKETKLYKEAGVLGDLDVAFHRLDLNI